MMHKINPFELKTKINALMAEFPELVEDEQLKLDTLEGETELFDVMETVVAHIREADVMQQAIDVRLKDLKARKDRYGQRENAWRNFAKQLMESAHLRNMALPEATLSIRPGRPSVRISDDKQIPKEFMRVKLEPNLSLIKDAIQSGDDVPGAMLNNSPDTLTILAK